MKLLSRVGNVVDVKLPVDAHLPDEERVTWHAKVLSVAERVEYLNAIERAEALLDPQARDAAITEVLKRCAVGWSNVTGQDDQPLAFSDEALSIFTPEQRCLFASLLPDAAGFADARSKKA